jgi:branched-chain amino acid transport system substrate-binding protein
MKRSTSLVALLAAVALIVSGCSKKEETPGATNKPEVKIYVIGALTGDYAQLFIHAAQGAHMAVDAANAKGDLPVKVTLVDGDSEGSKDKATPIANQLKDDSKVVGVIGPGFSGESFAVNPILAASGIPAITPSATNPGLNAIQNSSGKLWWRAVGNDNDQGTPAARLLFSYLKGKKVFIAHDKSAYGQGLATIVRDKVTADKGADVIAGFEGVDAGKKSYSALVSKIAGSDADFLFWGGYSPEGSLIMEQLRDRGSKITFLGADGSKDDTFLKAKEAVEGAYVTCPCSDANVATDDASKKFVADYKAKFNVPPGVYAEEGYDVANLFLDAIKGAGAPADITAYRAKIATALVGSNFPGIAKTYKFQANGELVAEQVHVFLFQVKDGAFVQVGDAATL